MNPKDQELMERYIYQVVRRLPKEQRNEVGLELQELIGDMQEDGSGMEAVLTKLGDPAEFAKKYQDQNRCLIGPEYYDTYRWVLNIVMLCTLIPLFMISFAEGASRSLTTGSIWWINSAADRIARGLGNAISNCGASCVSLFGGITLLFHVLEQQKVKLESKQKKAWSVQDLGDNLSAPKAHWTPKALSPIPHKKALIRRSDSIVSIVFIAVFCALLIFAPRFFSAVFQTDSGHTTIPIFNLDKWKIILPVFVLSMLIGMADEILHLIMGCYCKAVMISSLICGTLQITLSFVVLKVLPFWNPSFIAEVQAQLGEMPEFFAKWDAQTASSILLTGLVLITLLEVGTVVYKTLRYGVKKQNNPVEAMM